MKTNLTLLLTTLLGASLLQAEPLDMSYRQILLDDTVIAKSDGAEKVYHAAQTVPKRLISCETPVEREKLWIDRPSVIRDEKTGKFRMWYQVWNKEKDKAKDWVTLIAESDDGLTWVRPTLGKVPFRDDGGANNIVYNEWFRTVLQNPKGEGYITWITRPEERLLVDATGTTVTDVQKMPAMGLSRIPNMTLQREKHYAKAISDEARFMWDAPSQRFFATVKTGKPVPESAVPEWFRRSVALAWSTDGVEWDYNNVILSTDTDDDAYLSSLPYVDKTKPAWLEIDDMPVFRYQGVIVGLLSCMYMYNGERGGLNGEVFLAWTKDGKDWHRTHPRAPFIAGPKDSFMYGLFRAAATPPIRMGDELWFYHGVGGDQRNHSHQVYNPDGMGIAVSKLRLDGFASLHAGEKEAVVETKPFKIEDKPMVVNGDFSKGSCTAELVGGDNKVLATSEPMTGDGVAIELKWKGGSPAGGVGKEGFLRFKFTQGDLYSFSYELPPEAKGPAIDTTSIPAGTPKAASAPQATSTPAAPQTDAAVPAAAPKAKTNLAYEPASSPRNDKYMQMHQSFLERGKAGPIGVLFVGDSITEFWAKAPEVWTEHFGKYQPANFGIAGDKTQGVLWRIANGEFDGIDPKVVVLMIGTNNTTGYSASDITKGVRAIVEQLRAKMPQTKILLLGILPRGAREVKGVMEDPTAKNKAITAVNAALSKMDNGTTIRYLDLGDKFLDAEGKIPANLMPDQLHPGPEGYKVMAEGIQPVLDEMMAPSGQ